MNTKNVFLSILTLVTFYSFPSLAAENCAALAGDYLVTGQWDVRYTLNADCTGAYCAQTLNNWNAPNSGYDWHCDRDQEVSSGYGEKKVVGAKVEGDRMILQLLDGGEKRLPYSPSQRR